MKNKIQTIRYLQETHFSFKNTRRLRMKRRKKIFQANGNQKKAGVAVVISDKIEFKLKITKRDSEGNYIMIEGSIHQ